MELKAANNLSHKGILFDKGYKAGLGPGQRGISRAAFPDRARYRY